MLNSLQRVLFSLCAGLHQIGGSYSFCVRLSFVVLSGLFIGVERHATHLTVHFRLDFRQWRGCSDIRLKKKYKVLCIYMKKIYTCKHVNIMICSALACEALSNKSNMMLTGKYTLTLNPVTKLPPVVILNSLTPSSNQCSVILV